MAKGPGEGITIHFVIDSTSAGNAVIKEAGKIGRKVGDTIGKDASDALAKSFKAKGSKFFKLPPILSDADVAADLKRVQKAADDAAKIRERAADDRFKQRQRENRQIEAEDRRSQVEQQKIQRAENAEQRTVRREADAAARIREKAADDAFRNRQRDGRRAQVEEEKRQKAVRAVSLPVLADRTVQKDVDKAQKEEERVRERNLQKRLRGEEEMNARLLRDADDFSARYRRNNADMLAAIGHDDRVAHAKRIREARSTFDAISAAERKAALDRQRTRHTSDATFFAPGHFEKIAEMKRQREAAIASRKRIDAILESSGYNPQARHDFFNRAEQARKAQNAKNAKNDSFAGGKQSSRSAMMLFQVQQTIEDMSFAGLRGATNNLAFMGSMLGGPGGTIALWSVLGLTLVEVGRQFGVFDGVFGKTTAQLEKQKRLVEEMANAYKTLGDARHEGTVGARTNMPGDSTDVVERLANSRKAVQDAAIAAQNATAMATAPDEAMKAVEESAKRLAQLRSDRDFQAAATGLDQAQPTSTDTLDRQIATERRLLKEREQTLRDVLASDGGSPIMRGADVDVEATRKQVVASATERRDAARLAAEAAQRKAKAEFEESKKLQPKFDAEWQRRQKMAAVPSFGARADGMGSDEERALADVESRLDSIQDKEQRLRDLASEFPELEETWRGFVEQNADSHRSLLALRESLKAEVEATKDAERETAQVRAQFGRDVLRAAEQELSVVKSMTAEKQRQIEQERERIASINRAKQANQDQFGGSLFQTERSGVARFADIQAEKRKREVEAEMRARGFGQERIAQELAKIDERKNAFVKKRDEELFAQRQKFLEEQARGAGQAGDFDRQRSSLQELQQLQLGEVGQTDSYQRANAMFAQAQQTQQLIQRTYEQEKAQSQQKIGDIQSVIAKLNEERNAIQAVALAASSLKVINEQDVGRAQALNQQLLIIAMRLSAIKGAGDLGIDLPAAPQLGFPVAPQPPPPPMPQNLPHMPLPGFADGGKMGHDGLAYLHAGERVLTPAQTAVWESLGNRLGKPQPIVPAAAASASLLGGIKPDAPVAPSGASNNVTNIGTFVVKTNQQGVTTDRMMAGIKRFQRNQALRAGSDRVS